MDYETFKLITTLCSATGASLGPEAALSNVGGGIATYVTEHFVHFEDDNDRKLVVLSGN